MNYHCSSDDEISSMPAVQVKSVKVTLNLAGSGYLYAIICSETDTHQVTILISKKCDGSTNFKAAIFCTLAKIIVNDVLEKATKGDMMRKI